MHSSHLDMNYRGPGDDVAVVVVGHRVGEKGWGSLEEGKVTLCMGGGSR